MSTLGATTAHTVLLDWPAFGSWRADVTLIGGDVPAVGARATLTVGDLAAVGTVVRSGEDQPAKPRAVVVGGAGWDTLVTAPLSFQSDAGVRLSTVLTALSSIAGEDIEQPTDTTIGTYYECVASRMGEPVRVRDALAELVRAGVVPAWRVDPDGVTRFGARAGTEVAARATALGNDTATGTRKVGLDNPAGFLPGNTLDGVGIARLIVTETSGNLTGELWAAEPTSVREMVRRMIAAEIGDRLRTYVVAAVRADKRLDLIPPPDAQHLPEMAAVEQWTLGGSLVTPTVGTQVAVVFLDNRHSRPVAVAFQSLTTPTAVTLAGGGPAVGRVGDATQDGRLSWDAGALTLYYAPPGGPPYSWGAVAANANTPNPPINTDPGTAVHGVIAAGSSKVGCG